MNIQEAKDCIRDAVTSYLSRDENGDYSIPRAKQRPLVILGAPGLGKTAIMSQVAAELGIGYVGYAMTHHTRQSAIGLPMIEKAVYGGEEESVTRYTMSEIVASVYDEMERSGHREGILFIDEVNCVSETLAAAMLDLLQNKKLGPHRIPDGWVLTAAGNPPEYNESARELDVATSDRVRLIEVEPDADAWLRYAAGAGVHDAVRYYLSIKPGSLMSMERTPEGPRFATPRSWEDLSAVLKEHDRIGLPIGLPLISQYIRDPDIAAEFKRYLDFHRRYGREHDVDSILDGSADGTSMERADAEEKLSVISMVVGRLNSEAEEGLCLEALASLLGSCDRDDPKGWLKRTEDDLVRKSAPPATDDAVRSSSFCLKALKELELTEIGLQRASSEASARSVAHQRSFDAHLDNAMAFMDGSGRHGAVQLLSSLLGCYSVVMYSRPGGPLYRYNDELLSDGRDRKITDAMEALSDATHRVSKNGRGSRDNQDNIRRQDCRDSRIDRRPEGGIDRTEVPQRIPARKDDQDTVFRETHRPGCLRGFCRCIQNRIRRRRRSVLRIQSSLPVRLHPGVRRRILFHVQGRIPDGISRIRQGHEGIRIRSVAGDGPGQIERACRTFGRGRGVVQALRVGQDHAEGGTRRIV